MSAKTMTLSECITRAAKFQHYAMRLWVIGFDDRAAWAAMRAAYYYEQAKAAQS